MEHHGPLSVSQLTASITGLLEGQFPSVWIEGELSNVKPSSRGHLYFTLRDAEASLPCVMFRGDQRHLAFAPRDGDRVELRGRISVYAPRGAYQLISSSMVRAGAGRILAMIDERRRRLEAEGVFARSRALPAIPRRIAVITSPNGAAIRDILQILRRRGAPVDVLVVPVPVQGDPAAAEITRALQRVDAAGWAEVMILTRGGGSLEDLLAFSDEQLVRAIARCATPIVSAVGHETDWALSDFAADLRAPTPSAAAELVAPSRDELQTRILTARDLLQHSMRAQLERVGHRLSVAGTEELRFRLRSIMQPWYQRHDEALTAIRSAMATCLADRRARLSGTTGALAAASPYLALERGYAIVRSAAEGTDPGRILTRAEFARSAGALDVQFQDATLRVRRDSDE